MSRCPSKRRRLLYFALLGVLLLFVDIVTKYLAVEYLPHPTYPSYHYPYGGVGVFQDVLGIDFCLNCVTNRGGAWGLFSTYPKVLMVSRLLLIVCLGWYAVFGNQERQKDWAFLCILTGALSNIVDGFIYGAVIDMLHFTLWGYSFPVFNVADILICLGVCIVVIQSLIGKFNHSGLHEN